MIQRVKDNTKAEIQKLTVGTRSIYYSHLLETQKYQLERIKEEHYFRSDSLLALVNEVAYRIIEANQLKVDNPLFLISHDPHAQALTYINEVFEFSIGLLVLVQSEDQLAFIVAHELAHHVKHHVANAIYEIYELDLEKTIINEFSRILNGMGTLEGLEAMQSRSYDLFRLSRTNELVSDTLGLELMSKAGYDIKEALPILSATGYKYLNSDYPVAYLLNQLFRESYPLKSFWLDKGLNIYSRKPDMLFVFDTDSISTHPDMGIRMQRIRDATGVNIIEPLNLHSIEHSLPLKYAIDGAFSAKKYDACLYLSLFLLSQNSSQVHNDGFLVSTICKVFIGLYQAKYANIPTNNFSMYVGRYTIDYTDDLRQINEFLYNLTQEELIEIGYQFLNKSTNFDREIEEHYWLLYQFSEHSKRESVAKRIKDTYLEKFPTGSYLKEFR